MVADLAPNRIATQDGAEMNTTPQADHVAVLQRVAAEMNLRASDKYETIPHADVAEWRDKLTAAIEAMQRQGEPWQPIETAPKDVTCYFWVTPKTADEAYIDTSGNPIVSHAKPYIRQCKLGEWGALMKATHWHPMQELSPPPAAGGASR
jgi:hypothetical protein